MFGPEGFWGFIRNLRVIFLVGGGGREGGGLIFDLFWFIHIILNPKYPQGTTLVRGYGLYSAIWGGGGHWQK